MIVLVEIAGILNYRSFDSLHRKNMNIHRNICLERTHDSMCFTGINNVRDKNHKINRNKIKKNRNIEII